MLQEQKLLNFYFSTGFLELLFQRLSLVFGYAFFHSLGGTVNQFFGFLQAEA